jgi:hypothetical protein
VRGILRIVRRHFAEQLQNVWNAALWGGTPL